MSAGEGARWDDDLPAEWEQASDSPPPDAGERLILSEVQDRFVLRPASPPEGVRLSDIAVVSTVLVEVEP